MSAHRAEQALYHITNNKKKMGEMGTFRGSECCPIFLASGCQYHINTLTAGKVGVSKAERAGEGWRGGETRVAAH